MKKIIERIRTKEREEKAHVEIKKADATADRAHMPAESQGQPLATHPGATPPNDLFWDEYSDLGYC